MDKELRKLIKAAEQQGWTVRETKAGVQFVPPDRTKPMVQAHGTPSDRRAMKNLVSLLRRSGMRT